MDLFPTYKSLILVFQSRFRGSLLSLEYSLLAVGEHEFYRVSQYLSCEGMAFYSFLRLFISDIGWFYR